MKSQREFRIGRLAVVCGCTLLHRRAYGLRGLKVPVESPRSSDELPALFTTAFTPNETAATPAPAPVWRAVDGGSPHKLHQRSPASARPTHDRNKRGYGCLDRKSTRLNSSH